MAYTFAILWSVFSLLSIPLVSIYALVLVTELGRNRVEMAAMLGAIRGFTTVGVVLNFMVAMAAVVLALDGNEVATKVIAVVFAVITPPFSMHCAMTGAHADIVGVAATVTNMALSGVFAIQSLYSTLKTLDKFVKALVLFSYLAPGVGTVAAYLGSKCVSPDEKADDMDMYMRSVVASVSQWAQVVGAVAVALISAAFWHWFKLPWYLWILAGPGGAMAVVEAYVAFGTQAVASLGVADHAIRIILERAAEQGMPDLPANAQEVPL